MALKQFNVCLLHPRESAEFERHGTLPGCQTGHQHRHTHIPMREADRREVEGHGRFLDPAKRYMAAEPSRVWRPAGPSGLRNLQLVRGCITGRAGHFQTKVPALGARNRPQSVYLNNFVPTEAHPTP